MIGFTIFADIVNSILTVFCGCLLYSLFGKERMARHFTVLVSCVAISLFAVVLRFVDTGIIRFIILLALTFGIGFLYSMKTLHRILYCLLYVAFCVLSEGFTAILVSKILNLEVTQSTEGLFYVLGTIISKFIVLVMIMLIRLKRHKSLTGISIKHILVLVLVPISSLLVLVLQYSYNYTVALPTGIIWVFSISYLLLTISNIAVFDYIDSVHQNALDQGKIETASQIIKEQEKRFIAINQHYNEIAKFRHDQKNINIGILNEIKAGNTQSAIDHLNDSISLLSAQNIRSFGIIHTVVGIKSEEAKTYGIDFQFSYQDLQKVSISDIDIAVLLGNALDNAIEANQKIEQAQRNIELLISVRNSNLIIYIKNPVSEQIDTEKLVSSKHDSSHGFGVISMKQIVEKFNGDIVFNCNDHIFEVNIVLPNIVNDTINE